MIKSVLIAGAVGAAIFALLGTTFQTTAQQVFPSNTMLSSAAVGFGIGAGVQIVVRVLGVS